MTQVSVCLYVVCIRNGPSNNTKLEIEFYDGKCATKTVCVCVGFVEIFGTSICAGRKKKTLLNLFIVRLPTLSLAFKSNFRFESSLFSFCFSFPSKTSPATLSSFPSVELFKRSHFIFLCIRVQNS